MRNNLMRLGVSALLGLLAAGAHAQDVYMDMFNSANQAAVSMSLTTLNNAAVMSAYRNANGSAASRKAATGHRVNLSYAPSAALRQQTVRELSRKLQTSSPAAAQSVTSAFGPGKADYGQLFDKMVQQSGLPANNAATAFAAYLEIGYVIVNNVQDERSITPAMDRALQQQTAGLLGQNKALASPDAVAKFGEATKLQAILLYLGWQGARQNGQAAQFRSNIAQQFRRQGLDMSRLRLTTQGLVKR